MQPKQYTHNLKVILVDKSGNIIDKNNVFLGLVKRKLCEVNYHNVFINNQAEKIVIKWDKLELNETEKHFMGDLFKYSIYGFDSLVIKHVKEVIEEVVYDSLIQQDGTINFYVSKLPSDKTTCSQMIGLV